MDDLPENYDGRFLFKDCFYYFYFIYWLFDWLVDWLIA